MPHFHLSIQSGSAKILKKMNRSYTPQKILSITKLARKKIPLINFTCDILVGFPGEGETDFKQTSQLIEQVGFSKVHIFRYSKRPQTKAASFDNQVDDSIKQSRSAILKELVDNSSIRVKQGIIGKTLPVLWENKQQGYWYGFTNNYIKVRKKAVSNKDFKGNIQKINIKSANLIF